jgi:peptidoglycan/LPS O-acetylase OafA/YrhL
VRKRESPPPATVAAVTRHSVSGTGSVRRPDIQGLRAVAVLMVVAFHAGGPISGGFVGVDVFFVISGFVITAMLQREWVASGRIRFRRFYIRRFKRLTPALAVMVAVSTAAAVLVLSPLGPQQTAAKTAAGAMLLSANWVIAGVTGDYFDAPAESNPLLNTWSLSVEEQFYLLFPALLAIGWVIVGRRRGWFGSRATILIVAAVAVVSFALACLGAAGFSVIGDEYTVGFYGPLSRAWEFAVGALLALTVPSIWTPSKKHVPALAIAGAAALVASLWLIDGTVAFPGPWTLLPVVGTLLLILAGTGNVNPVSRALATRPMVKIGDWSYSLYLWHWPLIVFATLLWPQSGWAPRIAAALSFVPAVASYKWVEEPFRNLQGVRVRRGAILATAVVVPPIAIAAIVGSAATRYWTPKYESGEIRVAHEGDIGQVAFHTYVDQHNYPCMPTEIRKHAVTWEGLLRCHQSQPGAAVEVALIGDSHAEHLFLGLAEALPDRNVAYYIVNDRPVVENPDFKRILAFVGDSPSIRTVVLTSYWALRGVPEPGLSATLRSLTERGKAAVVTDDVPDFPFEPFGCKYRKAFFLPPECSQAIGTFQARHTTYFPQLQASVGAATGVRLVSTASYLCDEGDTCDMTRDDRLLYRDPHHLNINGSRFVAQRLVRDAPELASMASGAVAHGSRAEVTLP